MITRFLPALQQQTQKKLQIAGLVDIRLKDGIIFFYESEKIIVSMMVSKSSRFLVDLVEKF